MDAGIAGLGPAIWGPDTCGGAAEACSASSEASVGAAAAAPALALAQQRPKAVLHVGLAGGRGIPAGTLVLGSESLYCDLHADVHVARRTLPDEELLAAARAALPEALVTAIGTSAAVGAAWD